MSYDYFILWFFCVKYRFVIFIFLYGKIVMHFWLLLKRQLDMIFMVDRTRLFEFLWLLIGLCSSIFLDIPQTNTHKSFCRKNTRRLHHPTKNKQCKKNCKWTTSQSQANFFLLGEPTTNKKKKSWKIKVENVENFSLSIVYFEDEMDGHEKI